MRIRMYHAGDGESIERMLKGQEHDVQLPQFQNGAQVAGDILIVGGIESDKYNKLQGLMAGRPLVFVHQLEVPKDSPLRREFAASMVSYGIGHLAANGVKEIAFLVDKDNDTMQNFMVSRGAVKEQGNFDVWCLKVE